MLSSMARRAWGTGSLYQRADGRWVGRFVRDGRREYVTGMDRATVRKRLEEMRRSSHRATNETLGRYLERWLAGASSASPRTREGYEAIVAVHLRPRLGHIRLSKLTVGDVSAMVADELERYSPVTVRHVLACLRTALAAAVRDDLLTRNVASLVPAPYSPTVERRWLSADQAAALLDAVRGDRLEALYVLAITTGMRQGELLGLRWSDIEGDTLTVNRVLIYRGRSFRFADTKTRRSRRTLPLTARTQEALEAHRVRQESERRRAGGEWVENGLVFTRPFGSPIIGEHLTRSLRRHLERAGLPAVRFHDLRHTTASLMLSDGADLREVMEVLGHSTITLTANTYGHLSARAKRDAVGRLDRVLSAEKGDNKGDTPEELVG